MKLLRATCECGFHKLKARVGYHFHQWWFPILDISVGQLTDCSLKLPEDQIDLIQFGKASASELHPAFIEPATQELIGQYAIQSRFVFDAKIGSTFVCPNCCQSTLRMGQVHVKAFCTTDCGNEFPWPDSELQGCPKCNHRPHRFEVDTDAVFASPARTLSYCPCSSSMGSGSPVATYCPKCGQLPVSYETNGHSFCGIHHERLLPYQAPGNLLFMEASARWVAHRFPNAKLWGDADSDDSIATSYCPECEQDHQHWLATECDG